MFPMMFPPFMASGCMPGMAGPWPFPPTDPAMTGAMPTEEAKRQFLRIFLTFQKEQVTRAQRANTEYQKSLEEAMSAIDKQLAKLDETEAAAKRTSSTQAKQTNK